MSEAEPARGGRDAILAFEVTGPDSAEVLVAVEHRDEGDTMWSTAASLPACVPSMATLALPRVEGAVRVRLVGDPRGSVHIRLLPPEWVPC